MSYSAPLSERIRIQLEILCENTADCISNLSQNYRRPVLILCCFAMLLTMRASRKGIRSAKLGGYPSSGAYGAYGGTTTKKKKSLFCRLTGKCKASSSIGAYGGYGAGAGGYGGYGASAGGSSLYGGAGGGLSTGYGGASSSTYGGATGSTYGTGLRGTTAMGGAAGGSYGSTLGGAGASTYGGAASSMGTMGGATSTFGASSLGGAATGKSTSNLADSNPTSIVTLDPSIHFYNYGGSPSFSGQIETVQAYDAPNFVSQVLNQPGQNKVLIIDGGGIRPDAGAVFDSDMASAALRNGWKGVIVHGVVRNTAQLSRMQIGVKALGTSPIKGKGQMGQKSVPASIGSTQLQPGWWVYADGDGVVISQTDISGGSFGGGGGAVSQFGGGASTMGGGFGASSNTMGGSMGGSAFGSQGSTMGGASSMTGGYGAGGAAGGGLTGGYGNTAARSTMGGGYGTAAAGGMAGGSGLTGGYGSTTGGGLAGGYGSAASRIGSSGLSSGYGSSSTTGYGGYGSSSYGSGGSAYSYASSRKKKNKIFKMMLASSIAAIVWLVCLR